MVRDRQHHAHKCRIERERERERERETEKETYVDTLHVEGEGGYCRRGQHTKVEEDGERQRHGNDMSQYKNRENNSKRQRQK